jgi:Na+/H+ antiporter NhaD/arsenite permease-like protein
VYFGALTYVGNAPNFMIKAIAEDRGVAMPGFFAYLGWAAALLLPLVGLWSWLFA